MENLDALNRAGRHVSIRTMLKKEGFWLVFVGIILAISGLFLFNLFGLFSLIFGILILIFGIKMQRIANINYMWAISATLLMVGISNIILTNSDPNISYTWMYFGSIQIFLGVSVIIRYFRLIRSQIGEYDESDAKKVQDIIEEVDFANSTSDSRVIKFLNNQGFGGERFKGIMYDDYLVLKSTRNSIYFCNKDSITIDKIQKRPMQRDYNVKFSAPDRKMQAIMHQKYLERFKSWLGIKPENTESKKIEGANAAPHKIRFLNYILDGIAIIIIAIVVMFLYVAIIVLINPSLGKNGGLTFWIFLAIFILVKFFYYFIFDRRGKTLAKYVSKTRTVSKDGHKISTRQAVIRSLARFIPFESLSFLGVVSKGWHDSIAGTLVVTDKDLR